MRKLIKTDSEIKQHNIYKFHSKLDFKLTYSFFRQLFSVKRNSLTKNDNLIIIDTKSIAIDLNLWRNRHRIGKRNKKYNYSYCNSIGYYVGFKMILAINQNSDILGFEIYKNSPHDSKLLVPFVEKLIRSRIIRFGDIIVCDKGFTSKKNYQILINRFYVIPIIYPKKNTNIEKMIDGLNPPLHIFCKNKYKLKLWVKIAGEFKKLIANWENFKIIRSMIEDIFNIAKNSMGMKQMHQYTRSSVEKKVARIVFLTQKLIHLFDELNIEIKAIPFL